METRLESARLLTWKAATLKDAGQNFTKVSFKILPFLNNRIRFSLFFNVIHKSLVANLCTSSSANNYFYNVCIITLKRRNSIFP